VAETIYIYAVYLKIVWVTATTIREQFICCVMNFQFLLFDGTDSLTGTASYGPIPDLTGQIPE